MILKNVVRSLTILFVLVLSGCSTDEEIVTRAYPVINTKAASDITSSGVYLNGEILDVGPKGVADHGFVYDEVSAPSLKLSDRISLGPSTAPGTFSAFANQNLANGRAYFVKAYAISNDGILVYGQQVKFVSGGGAAPVFTDFTPKSGTIGDTVMINGSGFSSVAVDNTVQFGLFNAAVVKSTNDAVWCVVPQSTAVGDHALSVTVADVTATNAAKFSLLPIVFDSFSPAQASFGDTITLHGQNFPRQPLFLTIKVFDRVSVVAGATKEKIKVIVSERVVTAQASISIQGGVQIQTSTTELSLIKPVIDEFTPSSGASGTVISIVGNYFSPMKANNLVKLGDVELVVTEASKKLLKVTVPAGTNPGNYSLSVTVAEQTGAATEVFQVD